MTARDLTTGLQVTGTAQRDAWRHRALPPVEEVRPGLWSMPVPIPDSPLRYTLSYALPPATTGAVIVDPGWDSAEGRPALAAGLAAAGVTPRDVAGVVVTHVHPDHHGLSGWVREQSGAWIAMHPAEAETLPGGLWRARKPGCRPGLAARPGRARRRRRPSWSLDPARIAGGPGHGRAGPVRGRRRARCRSRAGTSGRSGRPGTPRATCACTTPRRACCSPATTCCPGSARTSACTAGRDRRDPLTDYLESLGRTGRSGRGGAARARVPVPRHRRPLGRPHRPPPRPRRRDPAGARPAGRAHRLGHREPADLVARLGGAARHDAPDGAGARPSPTCTTSPPSGRSAAAPGRRCTGPAPDRPVRSCAVPRRRSGAPSGRGGDDQPAARRAVRDRPLRVASVVLYALPVIGILIVRRPALSPTSVGSSALSRTCSPCTAGMSPGPATLTGAGLVLGDACALLSSCAC